MPKFKLEVPIIAHFVVEVEAENEEAALDAKIRVPGLCLQCSPKLYFNSDGIDWEKVEVYPVENA